MIQLRPFTDAEAWRVFLFLDGFDFIEAELVRGARALNVSLFADWRQVEGARLLSYVVVGRGGPFAVLGLSHTGQAGVAQAALLARDHKRHRRELAELGCAIRREMPAFCAEQGIHRVEARCWSDHPTASRFLEAVGFRHEADMPGFGTDGHATFQLYAYVHQQPQEVSPCA